MAGKASTRDYFKQSDPAHNPQFRRRWVEPQSKERKVRHSRNRAWRSDNTTH